MDIGIIVEGIEQSQFAAQPWMYCKDALLSKGIRIYVYHGGGDGFRRSFDAMCLHVWQDWRNRERFDAYRIMPVLEQFSTYRSRFPETIQIILNHTDMARRPYATFCWRDGNPVLYRTPAYDRTELAPFPPETIWSYEKVWGRNCFSLRSNPYRSGPPVPSRSATAENGSTMPLMASCRIVVCPRGWGENSSRHWDTWLSGKAMLTDRECDSVEMIPGIRLRESEHYLVFDDPNDIPDIVSDWTRPSRLADLAKIAENGRRAALSYDALERITQFFWSIK